MTYTYSISSSIAYMIPASQVGSTSFAWGQCATPQASASIAEFTLSLIDNMRRARRMRTAEIYKSALASWLRFAPACTQLADITASRVADYEAWLRRRGLTLNTISFYLRVLRAIYNKAVDQGLACNQNPFRRVYTGTSLTRKRCISCDELKCIARLDLPPGSRLAMARDVLLFLFFMRGMSFVDAANLKKSNLRHGRLAYKRSKTGQTISIKWEQPMQAIAERWGRPESTYLLPLLDNGNHRNALQRINRSLGRIAAMAGISSHLTTYVARHSWASIAKQKSIPIAVISEAMGHTSEATTRIYLSQCDSLTIDRANARLMRLLSQPKAKKR